MTACCVFLVVWLASNSSNPTTSFHWLQGEPTGRQGDATLRGKLSKGSSGDDVSEDDNVAPTLARATVKLSATLRAPSSGFQRLGRPFVISMEHRTDRMASFTREMAKVDITNITVVPGVPHECGRLGVTVAHIVALQLCWSSSWVDRCLIMEDDFALRLPPLKTGELIDRFLADIQDWDVFMLGCNLQGYATRSARNESLPPYVVRATRGYSSSAYVVKRTYAPNVTHSLLGGLGRLRNKCSQDDALDVIWGELQAKDGWYAMPNDARTSSRLGYQAASFSDIERKYADYGVR